MRLIPHVQKPYRHCCLLAEGEARLGHQAQPARGHPLVSAGATGARGRSGTWDRGEGGERSRSAEGQSRGEGGILCPTGDGDTETGVTHTHSHTRQGVCTHTPTHALLGAQKPLNALRPPAMPSGQSAQLGSRGWVGRGGGVLCLVQNPGLWVQNLLENALSSTGRGRADLPQRPPPPPPPHHQRPVENLYSVFT